jgi:hypothetical protein
MFCRGRRYAIANQYYKKTCICQAQPQAYPYRPLTALHSVQTLLQIALYSGAACLHKTTTMIRQTTIALMLSAFMACTKNNTESPFERKDFFADSSAAYMETVKALRYFAPTDSLLAIENIAYVDTKQKTYAIVFYKGKQETGNILFCHEWVQGELVSSSIKCTGENCDCKVRTIVKSNGDVKIDCTCTTCTMHITPKLDEVEP